MKTNFFKLHKGNIVGLSFIFICILISIIYNHVEKSNLKKNETIIEVAGDWYFIDNGVPGGLTYHLYILSNGSYSTTDFGGENVIIGKWRKEGRAIYFYEDGILWGKGIVFTNNQLELKTNIGSFYYKKNI